MTTPPQIRPAKPATTDQTDDAEQLVDEILAAINFERNTHP